MKVTLVILTEGNILHSFIQGEPDVNISADYSTSVQNSFDEAIAYMDLNEIDYSGFDKTLLKK